MLPGSPILQGVLAFSASLPTAASVDTNSGLVVLRGNHHDVTSVRVTAGGSNASTDVVFACNLEPAGTDVDLGNTTGLPVSPQRPGDVFELDVRLNSGGSFIGPFSISVFYSASALSIDSNVTEGTDLANGGGANFLLARTNDPPGEVEVVGSPNRRDQGGDAYHLFTLRFRVLNSSTVRDRMLVDRSRLTTTDSV